MIYDYIILHMITVVGVIIPSVNPTLSDSTSWNHGIYVVYWIQTVQDSS